MVTKVILNKVNSYKNSTFLETDKKINLIYGLNGTGKSTLADYLYECTKPCYTYCSIEGLSAEEILVYNQSFIRDYFYESDNLKGIFTLSKENREATEKIKQAEQKISELDKVKKLNNDEVISYSSDFANKKQFAEDTIWEIKTKYSGGDRVLEYCLAGLMGRKETLFNNLLNITKPDIQPQITIDQLKKEVDSVQGSTAQKYNAIPSINISVQHIEANQIFRKAIIGNENSTVAGLIKKLNNSDWVKNGLEFLPSEINDNGEFCPFCQERTITKSLIKNVRRYFDKTYENDISELNRNAIEYENATNKIPGKEVYESNAFIINNKMEFTNLYSSLEQCIIYNKDKIAEKIKTPSQDISLLESTNLINNLNIFISKINNCISEHNQKIDNKELTLKNIKEKFWSLMRWDYDKTISLFLNEKSITEKKLIDLKEQIDKYDKQINQQKQIITDQQKKTVNIEKAITNINNGLLELGIDGFRIEKHSEILYKIVRNEKCDNTFSTLSEGEKMIISFLYFRELCKGKKTASSVYSKKIIVIDDPISSLSHIYIFNIGQLIKNDFFNSMDYEQIFILTHSLYFFYEMTYPNHEKRNESQKLFRIIKNNTGSQILEMKYEEIQNDYQSYWSIIKDDKQPPALIANCMRNIIEYFFNFIEKKDLNNVFQKPELQATKYQAFCRYVNRESHSLGQNIFDFKEFNYNNFKEALGLVFKVSGYEEHYEAMIKH